MATTKKPEEELRQRTQEEEILNRQSAPKPDGATELARMEQEQMLANQGISPQNGAMDGFRALEAPIGKEAVQKATQILQKYKEGKANLENRIVDDEQWYKLRHWASMRSVVAVPATDPNSEKKFVGVKIKNQVEPTSGWLFNCIMNKHADALDNFPSANILPREEGDKGEAEMLSSIIPVILDQNDFEETYDEVSLYKLKEGTGVYGVFWDSTKLNGLGDIAIRKIDLLNLFWQPGITDIQRSRNLFSVELVDNDVLIGQYPQLYGKLSTQTINVAKYIYDDTIDTTEKSVVVDWYYKKTNPNGKSILHYCKFCNDVVLFATENDPRFAERGFYDHGKYPFVFDPLFRVEGTPAGFGYIDVGKSCQEYIDRSDQVILQNMMVNAKPRHFIRNDGSVNETEYADLTKDFVHVDGNLGQDSILPIKGNILSDVYVNVHQLKIDELKETTGNRDISTGGTTSGVTAASAIAAMQEAGSKLSRDSNKASYRAFREIVLLCIELIRQFYDLPRCFRIMGQNGTARFIQYSNAGIQPQMQGMEFGLDMGVRVPLFDVEVTAQKQSPYSKMSQNELALQFYSAGFFNPAMADQALACLDMMDFDRKEEIMQKIATNGTMLQQMMMLASMVDGGAGEISQGLAMQYGLPMAQGAPGEPAEKNNNLGGMEGVDEAENTKKARQRTAESTAPR